MRMKAVRDRNLPLRQSVVEEMTDHLKDEMHD
jgi:hypothetical protein